MLRPYNQCVTAWAWEPGLLIFQTYGVGVSVGSQGVDGAIVGVLMGVLVGVFVGVGVVIAVGVNVFIGVGEGV
jgi:hypothetical protein